MKSKPHIVIIARDGANWLGGRQYNLNLLRALIAYRGASTQFDISLLVKSSGELVHYQSLRPYLRDVVVDEALFAPWTLVNRLRWKFKRTLGGWTNPRSEEALLRLGATFAYPYSSAVIPSVDWFPDFQHRHFPANMIAAETLARELEISTMVNNAQRIALSSRAAETDCLRFFPNSRGRTFVLQFRAFADPEWLSIDAVAVRHKYHLPERFGLVSNWLVPTKNHKLILEALSLIAPARRRAIHIVCTGEIYDPRNPGFYNSFLNRIHTLGLRENVSVLGIIPKADQIQLLRLAHAYIQPSLSEGWNTGVEEAHMFGCPVILSDIPVHREQSPLGAVYFNPNAAHDLALRLEDSFCAEDIDEKMPRQEEALVKYAELQRDFGRALFSISQSK